MPENKQKDGSNMRQDDKQETNRLQETETGQTEYAVKDAKSSRHSKGKEVLSYLLPMAIAFAAAIVVSNVVLINAVIPSKSMENLLHKKDRLFGFRLAYALEDPQRYDVVMFHYPVHEETIYIKRVIGLPGETVEIKKGRIYIDGAKEPIKEDYLPEKWMTGNDGFVFEVPKDCYMMLGDNRNISGDSRYWAQEAVDGGVAANWEEAKQYTYVHKDKIIGRAILKYYPNFHWFINI